MESSNPLLSVLIPTRNRDRYLSHSIQSALNVPSSDIEIIVSENHGSDAGWEVANSFSDPRLKVVRPDKPLPMHENWEFLLSQSRGRWITFIGDDDAVMPHCVAYLSYLESRFPEAEAIVSPRAYYFWEQAYNLEDASKCSFNFTHREVWKDSKKALNLCLANKINYLDLPQIYSGGFQRRSLIQRVIRLQSGHYFQSVTPDAYSAVVATLHTYRYLEVGVPLTWIGTSPSSKVLPSAKNKINDFFGLHSESFSMNPCLGSTYEHWPFLIYFFEAYIAAAPFVSLQEFSLSRIREIYRVAAKELILRGQMQSSIDLATSLGVEPAKPDFLRCHLMKHLIKRGVRLVLKVWNAFRQRLPAQLTRRLGHQVSFYYNYKATGDQCPDILASDVAVASAYNQYQALHMLPEERHLNTRI